MFLPDQGDEGFSGLPGSDGEPGEDVSFSLLYLEILLFSTYLLIIEYVATMVSHIHRAYLEFQELKGHQGHLDQR